MKALIHRVLYTDPEGRKRQPNVNLSLQTLKVKFPDQLSEPAWSGGDNGGEYASCFLSSNSSVPPNSVMYSIFDVFDLLR